MLKPLERKMEPAQVLDLYAKRYACKDYDPQRVVSEEDLNAILEVGRLSPSSMGMEPWKFLVLQPGAVIDEILPHCWGVRPAPSHYVFLLGREPQHFDAGADYVAKIHAQVQKRPVEALEKRYQIMQDFFTRDLALADAGARRVWVDKQVYIAMGFMLSAAALLGVDSTPIEGMNFPLVERILVRQGLVDPQEYHLAGLITFGYTSRAAHRPKTRREADEVIAWA